MRVLHGTEPCRSSTSPLREGKLVPQPNLPMRWSSVQGGTVQGSAVHLRTKAWQEQTRLRMHAPLHAQPACSSILPPACGQRHCLAAAHRWVGPARRHRGLDGAGRRCAHRGGLDITMLLSMQAHCAHAVHSTLITSVMCMTAKALRQHACSACPPHLHAFFCETVLRTCSPAYHASLVAPRPSSAMSSYGLISKTHASHKVATRQWSAKHGANCVRTWPLSRGP
jgi:hypothetical protein